MQKLRDEVLQAEQVRSDLLKWKLALVGAIGAAGLGFAGSRGPGGADLVLCAVPLVCLYVDLLCHHLSLRILVIGSFLRTHQDGLLTEESELSGQPSDESEQSTEAAVLAKYEKTAAEMRALRLVPRSIRDRARDLLANARLLARRKVSAFDLEDWALSGSTLVVSLLVLIYGMGVWIDNGCIKGAAFLISGVLGVVVTMLASISFGDRFRAIEESGHDPGGLVEDGSVSGRA
jgi:hypothetical protein